MSSTCRCETVPVPADVSLDGGTNVSAIDASALCGAGEREDLHVHEGSLVEPVRAVSSTFAGAAEAARSFRQRVGEDPADGAPEPEPVGAAEGEVSN